MRIPDEVRRCVAFLGFRQPTGGPPKLAGTVFFASQDLGLTPARRAVYAITAQHVIDGVRQKGGQLCVRLNQREGGATWVDFEISRFRSHPNHPTFEAIDVSVAHLETGFDVKEYDYITIGLENMITADRMTKLDIGTGDEVFVTGLFLHHHGEHRNLPIVRVGNIAGLPDEKVSTRFGEIQAILVEARSIGGLSGSPVFVFLQPRQWKNPGVSVPSFFGGSFYLLGVMQGHFDSNQMPEVDELSETPSSPVDSLQAKDVERVNVGIAVVTPIVKVMETIEAPAMKAVNERLRDAFRRKDADSIPDSERITDR
jgi:hypothetical protein